MYLEPASTIPHEVSFLDTDGLERDIDPADVAGWTLLVVDCGNERRLGRDPRGAAGQRRDAWSTSTTTTTTAASATSTSSTATRRRPPRSWRGSSTASASRSRPRSPRRSTSAWSPTPAGSSTARRAPRRSGSRPGWSRPAPTSTRSSSACSSRCQLGKLLLLGRVHRAHRALLRGAPARVARQPRGPGARRGRRGHHRGADRPPAGRRGRAGRRPHPRAGAAARRHDHPEPGLAALARPDRRVADRPQVRGRGPQAGGRVLASRHASTTSASSSSPRSPPSWKSRPPEVDAPDGAAHRPRPRRQARRAELVRRPAVAAAGAGAEAGPRRHARPVRDGAPARPGRAGRPAWPRTSPGLDKRYEAVVQFGPCRRRSTRRESSSRPGRGDRRGGRRRGCRRDDR